MTLEAGPAMRVVRKCACTTQEFERDLILLDDKQDPNVGTLALCLESLQKTCGVQCPSAKITVSPRRTFGQEGIIFSGGSAQPWKRQVDPNLQKLKDSLSPMSREELGTLIHSLSL